MRKLIAAATIVVAGVSVGGTAFAGEINGSRNHGNPDKGNETPVEGHIAASECSFSGLEDGSEGETPYAPGNVQNWGSIPKAVRDTFGGFNPGMGCNPTFGD